MKELSLHILDIVQNSIKANASDIQILINENIKNNLLEITITDNGCGMSEELLARVKDPFATTRTTRKVGMGISLFEAAANMCGGHLLIDSKLGQGTKVYACFEYDSIDRAPIGDMAETMVSVILSAPQINYVYIHQKGDKKFLFDTKELIETLGSVPLDTPEILQWIKGFITEGLDGIEI